MLKYYEWWSNPAHRKKTKIELARGVFKKVYEEDVQSKKDAHHVVRHLDFLARAKENANPTVRYVKAIRDVSEGVVGLDSWL